MVLATRSTKHREGGHASYSGERWKSATRNNNGTHAACRPRARRKRTKEERHLPAAQTHEHALASSRRDERRIPTKKQTTQRGGTQSRRRERAEDAKKEISGHQRKKRPPRECRYKRAGERRNAPEPRRTRPCLPDIFALALAVSLPRRSLLLPRLGRRSAAAGQIAVVPLLLPLQRLSRSPNEDKSKSNATQIPHDTFRNAPERPDTAHFEPRLLLLERG